MCTYAGIYSSSKVAGKQLSETLRVELEPLGVRVSTAMVGAVHTPIHEKVGELNLPADSYYKQIREFINNQRQGLMQPNPQDVERTSKNLVHDILSGHTGLIWRGGWSTISRYISWLLPAMLFEGVINGGRGLPELKCGWAK